MPALNPRDDKCARNETKLLLGLKLVPEQALTLLQPAMTTLYGYGYVFSRIVQVHPFIKIGQHITDTHLWPRKIVSSAHGRFFRKPRISSTISKIFLSLLAFDSAN